VKYIDTKSFEIFCFKSEKSMKDYLSVFENRTDVIVRTFYIKHKDIELNDKFILDR